mmetsp:Transcript_25638/g.52495  ORF Transcript_25638/g.52495 Transcript_25638/m.52495 type:complete len:415 (-) Transcript_25638:96-1340(-)
MNGAGAVAPSANATDKASVGIRYITKLSVNMSAPDVTENGLNQKDAIIKRSPSLPLTTAEIEEREPLTGTEYSNSKQPSRGDGGSGSDVTKKGLQVLVLLAVQNCSKNLLMRYVMKSQPDFLTSVAVIGVETLKLVFSTIYILAIERKSLTTIVTYMHEDWKGSLLLAVPAAAYSLQMSLEYVALANIDAATFSVLVQMKLLATASFAAIVLRKKLKRVQVISLVLLTAGVMLCNFAKMLTGEGKDGEGHDENDSNRLRGITATLGIALSSGFASVYTEKVIKGQRNRSQRRGEYSLAYTQVQLAIVSLIIMGVYATIEDFKDIVVKGLFHNFNGPAFLSIFNSSIGGLIVAAVLKFADAVLKGYATAISVVMTGVLSMILFGTQLNTLYFLGIVNVVCAVLLYNGKNLNDNMC